MSKSAGTYWHEKKTNKKKTKLILIIFFIPFSINLTLIFVWMFFLSLICILPHSNCHHIWLLLWPIFLSFSHFSTSVLSHKKHNPNCFKQKFTLNSAPFTTPSPIPILCTLHTFPPEHGIPQNQLGKGARLKIKIW